MVILANFTDKGTFEQKYEGKRGEVVEFWIFFFNFSNPILKFYKLCPVQTTSGFKNVLLLLSHFSRVQLRATP